MSAAHQRKDHASCSGWAVAEGLNLAQLPKLGKRIKELRGKKGLTQTDLAQASGVSRVYISGIERGIRNLTVPT